MSTKDSPLKLPVHWILDWDGTITQNDTLNVLVNIAASTKPTFPTQERWKYVVDAYISDYTTTLACLAPGGFLPTTIESEKKLLQDMKPVEQRSLFRVSTSKIFEGLTHKTLEEGAKKAINTGEVSLRPGCVEFLHYISAQATPEVDNFHILSVNWSQHFISSCLHASNISINPHLILANELADIPENQPSTGEISPSGSASLKIIASEDKLQYLEKLRKNSEAKIVYMGDSWTDIECLLAADLGICVRDEEMGSGQRKLAKAFGRLGVDVSRLADVSEAGEAKVVWVRDFDEVREWAGKYGMLSVK